MKKLGQNIQNHWRTIKCATYVNKTIKSRREKGTEEMFDVKIAEHFPRLMTLNQKSGKLSKHQAG